MDEMILFSPSEAASGIMSLTEDGFWDSHHRRELLHALRARWRDFTPDQRLLLETRILAGPPRYDREKRVDYARRKPATVVSILGWLEQQGCNLSRRTERTLLRLRSTVEGWNPSRDAHADDSLDGRGGWIGTEADPGKLVHAPLNEIIPLAEKLTVRPFDEFTVYKPFQGLVQQWPRRAVSALSYEMRHQRYPVSFWSTALSSWPANASERLRWLLAHRIARLPKKVVVELRHDISSWMKDNLPALARSSRGAALMVWDQIADRLIEAGSAATESALGDVHVAGKWQRQSRRTFSHSLNAPVGKLTEALFTILNDLKLKGRARVPVEVASRLEWLFQAPGEAADHAVCETTARLRWLYFLDPEWVRQKIVPLFQHTNPSAEPAWNGFSYTDQLPTPELFALLKADFLEAVRRAVRWHWTHDEQRRLHQFLVIACYWYRKDRRYVSYVETRTVLQTIDDEGRSDAIWCLMQIIKEQRAWTSFGKPFLEQAWPKEKKFQTEATTRGLLHLAESSGRNFPKVVVTVLPLLTAVPHLDLFLHRTGKNDADEEPDLATKFPEPMLALLDRVVPDDPSTAPYELGSVIESIAKSKPTLRQDARWRRLKSLVDRR